jgi:membrane protease YdiL (CAAX protease family)
MTDPTWEPPFPTTGAPYPGAPVTYVEAAESGVALRTPRWGMGDVALALLIAIFVPTLVLGFVIAMGVSTTGAAVLLASLALPWLGFGLYPWWATRRKGNGVKVDLGFTVRLSDWGWGIGGGIACLVLGGIVATLTERVFGSFDSAAGNALAEADVSRWVVWVFALCAMIGAPMFEELCFRGLVFASVAKFTAERGLPAVPWATVVSAALFAGIHLEPVRFPLLLTIGLVLSWLRARTGRVGASIIAHAFNNSLSVVGLLFGAG